MSAVKLVPHHPESPQACAHQALRRLIYRIGVKESADLLGCSDDTIARRLQAGNINAFGWADVMALKKRERDEFGTSELHDAETGAIYRTPQLVPLNMASQLSQEIGESAGIIARVNAVLMDGKLDRSDLPDLNALHGQLTEHASHQALLLNHLGLVIADLKRKSA